MRRLLTEREVCELLSVGRTTLRSLSLRPVHVNRCVRYVSTDVGEYIDRLKRSGSDGTEARASISRRCRSATTVGSAATQLDG